MSIASAVRDFFNKTADARFKRDAQGRLVFFPWGFGRGRIVPDAAVEAKLRRVSIQVVVAIFVAVVPALAIVNAVYKPQGLAFAGYIAACAALGFALQIYPAWMARSLPYSDERFSYAAAMLQSLDRFGRKFLIFGLVSSLVFVAIGLLFLVFGGGTDRFAMAISVFVFAPMACVYWVALKRRRNKEAGV